VSPAIKPRNPFVESELQEELPGIAAPGRRVAVTGNRGTTARDRAVVRETMRALVAAPGISEIWFGGALGADTMALEAALELRRGARPRLIVVLPDTLAAQPRETRAASERADERIELGHPIRAEDRWRAYHERNRYLVEHATQLIAFWNGEPRSGTAATIGLARKRGMPVEVVEVEGEDETEGGGR
jgi:predicted Rossmann fold nucleotide-binding protein DprA/Smf involved in DNA uptake